MTGIQIESSSTKPLLTILVVITSFLLIFSGLQGLFGVHTSPMGSMRRDNRTPNQNLITTISIAFVLALLVGTLVFFWLKTQRKEEATSITKREELEIIKQALSEDEKAVLDEIGRAGEITQDSLRFRLEWSKSKVSRILSRLDKMNIIQRERTGKTYTVFLTQKKPKK
ncbi:MAG: helix-turn-helix transcriptional regulator [Thermoproteota archaeon]